MSALQRFTIQVGGDWQVNITGPLGLPVGQPGQLLPDGRETPPANAPVEATISALAPINEETTHTEIFKRTVENRSPQGEDLQNLGKLLFDRLIGENNFQAIRAEAARNPGQDIELAILLDNKGPGAMLHRLNWELMHGPEDFLAREMAISRLVPPAKISDEEEPYSPRPPTLPPRVLFVIGSDLATDEEIQPGAEYFSLLRLLHSKNRTINDRVLQRASPEKVQGEVAKFQPDVVHFICHGQFHPQLGGYLKLETDDATIDENRYARHLLEDLKVGDRLPPVVVLSACYSGTVLGAAEVGPLAAELVAGGVPVVIAMGGRVSDVACRLFTRRFGAALLEGMPLVQATAEGRWAALLGDRPNTVDWAFPSIFMDARLEAGFQPHASEEVQRHRRVIESRISAYGIWEPDSPAFSARHEFFDDYLALLDDGSDLVILGIYTKIADKGIGRTRLLKELAVRAVQDGHVPILVTDTPDPPDLKTLARIIFEAILRTRRDIWELGFPEESQIIKLIDLDKTIDEVRANKDLDREISYELSKGEITPRAVQLAIQLDLEKFIETVYEAHEDVKAAGGRVLVMLDNVDRYGENLTDSLLSQMLGPRGLGTKNHPVPVIFNFSNVNPVKLVFDGYFSGAKTKPGLRLVALEPFRNEAEIDGQKKPAYEDMLAYKRILLHGYRHIPTPMAIQDDVSLAGGEDFEKFVENWIRIFRDHLKGLPGNFDNLSLIALLIDAAESAGFLVKANDEHLLQELRDSQKK